MSSVLVERDAEVALVRLNRPAAMNAVNEDIRRELPAALAALEADPAVRAVVITGAATGPSLRVRTWKKLRALLRPTWKAGSPESTRCSRPCVQ